MYIYILIYTSMYISKQRYYILSLKLTCIKCAEWDMFFLAKTMLAYGNSVYNSHFWGHLEVIKTALLTLAGLVYIEWFGQLSAYLRCSSLGLLKQVILGQHISSVSSLTWECSYDNCRGAKKTCAFISLYLYWSANNPLAKQVTWSRRSSEWEGISRLYGNGSTR